MTAKAIANALGKNIIILNLSNIVSSRIGETSQNIKMILIKQQEKDLFFSLMNSIKSEKQEAVMIRM
jgi:SpoVK/Ycf46/Vps4 family AAA+-type ATPase